MNFALNLPLPSDSCSWIERQILLDNLSLAGQKVNHVPLSNESLSLLRCHIHLPSKSAKVFNQGRSSFRPEERSTSEPREQLPRSEWSRICAGAESAGKNLPRNGYRTLRTFPRDQSQSKRKILKFHYFWRIDKIVRKYWPKLRECVCWGWKLDVDASCN